MKTVVIRKRPSKVKLPKEVKAEAKQNLGSVFDGRQPLNPLTPTQSRKWIPKLVGLPYDHLDYPEKETNYWAEMSIKVGFAGTELNITTDDKGEPLELEDYLAYLWAIKHPTCAENENAMRRDPRMTHYIFDENEEVLAKEKIVDLGLKATALLAKDVKDDKKCAAIVWGITKGQTNPKRLTASKIKSMLYDYSHKTPKEYIDISQDKSIAIKAEIYELVDAQILTKVGNSYIYIDEPLGDTLDTTVAWFKDEARNSKVILEMRTKLQEFAKTT